MAAACCNVLQRSMLGHSLQAQQIALGFAIACASGSLNYEKLSHAHTYRYTAMKYYTHSDNPMSRSQGFADVHPSSHPVNIPDMEWQDSDPSSDVIVAMDGMLKNKASQCSRYDRYRIKSSRPHVEPGSADSMFAWLSRLLPGL